ncbi:MAG: hypothetical protein GXX79_04840 [Actinomycetales bacterium]|nr:hypothetical protein [Actinomycetales bacterium]
MLNLEDLVLHGSSGVIDLGRGVAEVVSSLGLPEMREPQKKSYPEILKYGDIEVRFRWGVLEGVSVNLSPGIPVEGYCFEVEGFWPESRRCIWEVGRMLEGSEVSWAPDPIMSDPGSPVWVTEAGVHLAFHGDLLCRLGVARVTGQSSMRESQ